MIRDSAFTVCQRSPPPSCMTMTTLGFDGWLHQGFARDNTRAAITFAPGRDQSCGSTSQSTIVLPRDATTSRSVWLTKPPGGRNQRDATPLNPNVVIVMHDGGGDRWQTVN